MCECVCVGWGVSYMEYNSFWMKVSFREPFRYSYGTTLHKAERGRDPLSLCACWHMCKQRSEVDIYHHYFICLLVYLFIYWLIDWDSVSLSLEFRQLARLASWWAPVFWLPMSPKSLHQDFFMGAKGPHLGPSTFVASTSLIKPSLQ